jgi:predicted GNAT family N-acyltransferase
MGSTKSDFLDFVPPLNERIDLYDKTSPPRQQPKNDAADPIRALPQGFIDGMIVREEVFVKEQKIPLENELDFDDYRCFHWIAYASVPDSTHRCHLPDADESARTGMPIGYIRLVPPPNTAYHEFEKHRNMDGTSHSGDISSSFHDGKEPFIKLGRLAVLKDYRKMQISKLLIDSVLSFAERNPEIIPQPVEPSFVGQLQAAMGADLDLNTNWHGLVLIHAQIGLQKFWAKYGFELDEKMGIWDEEGIDHAGMWKRIDLEDVH